MHSNEQKCPKCENVILDRIEGTNPPVFSCAMCGATYLRRIPIQNPPFEIISQGIKKVGFDKQEMYEIVVKSKSKIEDIIVELKNLAYEKGWAMPIVSGGKGKYTILFKMKVNPGVRNYTVDIETPWWMVKWKKIYLKGEMGKPDVEIEMIDEDHELVYGTIRDIGIEPTNNPKGHLHFKCPVCETGDLTAEWWNYPATRDEPPDGGYEIVKQTCDCEIDDDKLGDAVEKAFKDEAEVRREEDMMESEAQIHRHEDEENQWLEHLESESWFRMPQNVADIIGDIAPEVPEDKRREVGKKVVELLKQQNWKVDVEALKNPPYEICRVCDYRIDDQTAMLRHIEKHWQNGEIQAEQHGDLGNFIDQLHDEFTYSGNPRKKHLVTLSGREIPLPAPKVSDKGLDKWLVEQSIEEAKHRHDEWNTMMFTNLDPKNLQRADRDLLNEYLFGVESVKFYENPPDKCPKCGKTKIAPEDYGDYDDACEWACHCPETPADRWNSLTQTERQDMIYSWFGYPGEEGAVQPTVDANKRFEEQLVPDQERIAKTLEQVMKIEEEEMAYGFNEAKRLSEESMNPPEKNPKWSKSSVQSVLFDKSRWSVAKAKEWLKKHDFKYGDVDEKPNVLRFRQIEPSQMTKDHYAIIPFGKVKGDHFSIGDVSTGIMATIGDPKKNPYTPDQMKKYNVYYKGKEAQVDATSAFEAQKKGAELFKAKKEWLVSVMLEGSTDFMYNPCAGSPYKCWSDDVEQNVPSSNWIRQDFKFKKVIEVEYAPEILKKAIERAVLELFGAGKVTIAPYDDKGINGLEITVPIEILPEDVTQRKAKLNEIDKIVQKHIDELMPKEYVFEP